MSARARSDRLNPVLLKEVRQALRSRTFAILFPTCLAVAVVFAIGVLVDRSQVENPGPSVFMPVFVILEIAALGLVPFSAFQSMAGEWDEGSHDLLVLSHLSPGRIVLGKLLTASVEAGLYFCAFLPLLLFTFLLRGVDVRDVLFLVVTLYVASMAMCCVALAAAGLSRLRFLRVVLLAALAGLGFGALVVGVELAEQFVERGRGFGTGFSNDDLLGLAFTLVGTGLVAFMFATTRIAHPEDDRSGAPRVAFTAILVAALAVIGFGLAGSVSQQDVYQWAAILAVCTSIPAIFFATEADRLPRRVRANVPANTVWAILATPFLPGGGRGVLWYLVQLALIAVWAFVVSAGLASSPDLHMYAWDTVGAQRWFAFVSYFVIYVAGFSLLCLRITDRPGGRLVARLALPVGALLTMLLPALIGFVFGIRGWESMKHPFFPFWTVFDKDAAPVRTYAILCGLVALGASTPRLVRAVSEVLAARRVRAARALEVATHGG